MEKKIYAIKEKAQKKEKENQEFRFFLKGYKHHQVDEIVHKLYQKYLSRYDCTECGNCCELSATLNQEEVEEIAKYLNISYKNMKKKYIERKTAEGFLLKGRKCPFLYENKCSIYKYRPKVCRSYPHLHKDNINHRLISIFDNFYICPIVYSTIEELKERIWTKNM